MPEKQDSIKFQDAEHVQQVMDKMAIEFAGSTAFVGVGVLASFASAISILASEIETLKSQK